MTNRTIDTTPARTFALSVVMPVHNEQRTITDAVGDVLSLDTRFPVELIVVDDGSTDETPLILSQIDDPRLVVHRHPGNLGKGAAVLSGAAIATGTHMVVFDADREYVAVDLLPMCEAVRSGRAAVVYGTRMFGMNTVYRSFRYAIGNRVTTFVANVLFDAYLTDLHTCLKLMPVNLFHELELTHRGFGLDSEISGELLRRGYRPFEVPVSYMSRSHAQGKKLTWRDGVECLQVLSRVRMRGRIDDGLSGVRAPAEDVNGRPTRDPSLAGPIHMDDRWMGPVHPVEGFRAGDPTAKTPAGFDHGPGR
jgi:dolichol-phosphate hexosyltransferase